MQISALRPRVRGWAGGLRDGRRIAEAAPFGWETQLLLLLLRWYECAVVLYSLL